jgi:hypothetical protein
MPLDGSSARLDLGGVVGVVEYDEDAPVCGQRTKHGGSLVEHDRRCGRGSDGALG